MNNNSNQVNNTNSSSYQNNYPNGYQNNFYNNYNNFSNHQNTNIIRKAVKSSKNLSIAYVCIFLILIACTVVVGIYLEKYFSDTLASINNPSREDSKSILNSLITNFFDFIYALTADIFVGIILLVMDIVLIVRTNVLKNYYPEHSNLWIVFLVGLFIAIPSFVAAIMTISACKKIEKNNYNSSNNFSNQSSPTF